MKYKGQVHFIIKITGLFFFSDEKHMYVNNCGVIVLVQHLTVFCKYQNIFPPSPLQPRDGS